MAHSSGLVRFLRAIFMGVTLVVGPSERVIGPDPASLQCVEEILQQNSVDAAYFLPSTLEALCKSSQYIKSLSRLKLIGFGGGEYRSLHSQHVTPAKITTQVLSLRKPATPSFNVARIPPSTTASAAQMAAPLSHTSQTAKTGNTFATARITTVLTGENLPQAFTKWSSCATRILKCTRVPSQRTLSSKNGRREISIPGTTRNPTTGVMKPEPTILSFPRTARSLIR